ncbi:AbrB/MazE/SpoVT family DNA-binding domain-containing protein [Jiella sp. CBK1P-4]|uniref:AbrB/MazE/SpoVT family DNA-binding domain-containing protein n=2 Tax=Jiella avicenniae TaxID=2907202 RepID=A0A9X1P025_9HYPH|nr:AbrB/MazE/SpoVT family DNA-binding domain-containing protein [Jiella avicenniae]MCE7027860.1 AbrB/MazE/SpoVT family DNA-binding domain-containing protein [Jiella avicenniae]
MSITLTVTKDGAVALGPELLEHLGVEPGEALDVDLDPCGKISLSAARPEGSRNDERPRGRIEDTFGMLHHLANGPAPTIEELNDVIADGWAGRR